MWWVIDSMNKVNQEVYLLKSHMAHLIDPNGEIVPSTGNMIERQKLKEELIEKISDLHVRLKLVEADCRLK